jgi:peptidoglycan LD-endopeptidase CwlK
MPKQGEVLAGLEPSFRDQVVDVMGRADAQGFRVVPYGGTRDPWRQAILWRQSRTTSQIQQKLTELRNAGAPFIAEILDSVGPHNGPFRTKAVPGGSWHQYRSAVDCYVATPTGAALWRDADQDGAEFNTAVVLYDRLGAIATQVGLTSGVHWQWDYGHLQTGAAQTPQEEFGSWTAVDARIKALWGDPV